MADTRQALTALVPWVASVIDASGVGGGCISEASCVKVCDQAGGQRQLFVKSNRVSFLNNFQAEWDGLVRLSQVGVIGVPNPIAVGTAAGQSWLVTEWIEQEPRPRDFFVRFGQALAELHQSTLGGQIGLPDDNFLGSARQINTPADSWAGFFAEHRIGYQIRWAAEQGLADSPLRRDVEQIAASMDQLLAGRDERTSLLHGDLWSGNYLCGEGGQPVIIDPAVYHGCREAEFGMIQLFGSCPQTFYDAYLDRFPMPPGWQRRVRVYVLYHLLNHLNLFGRSYYDQCRRVAGEILRSP